MICAQCAAGADLATEPAPQLEPTRQLAVALHNECAGCDCQHRVADLDELAKRRAAMPPGGLARIVGHLTT